jgi:hypothetical protein
VLSSTVSPPRTPTATSGSMTPRTMTTGRRRRRPRLRRRCRRPKPLPRIVLHGGHRLVSWPTLVEGDGNNNDDAVAGTVGTERQWLPGAPSLRRPIYVNRGMGIFFPYRLHISSASNMTSSTQKKSSTASPWWV